MNIKKVLAWSSYDLANTAFSALFVTFFYPLYIKEFLGGTEFQIGLIFGMSMLAVAIFVPIIGALSDAIHRRMPFIIIFTLICVIFTATTAYSSLKIALAIGFIANFFYHAALTTYNALLPQISHKKEMGFTSGIGVAFGYVGTLLSLAMAYGIFAVFGWESKTAIMLMFPATAMFFLLLSLPTFFGIREQVKTVHRHILSRQEVIRSTKAVLQTVLHMTRHKGMVPFLLSIFSTINAISAVIIFLFLYSRSELVLSIQQFIIVYAIFSLSATIGSFFYGKLIDKISAKNGLAIAGILWILVIFILLLSKTYISFIIAGIIGGVALGAVWTSIRPLLIELSPKKHVGQFFGFTELADKFSGILGPIVFGALSTYYNYNYALISLLFFFFFGLVMLQLMPGKK